MRLLFVLLLTSLSLHSQKTIESISYADYLNIDSSNDFIVFTLGLICYLVGTQYDDENIRNLLSILTFIIYIIAAIFLFFMIKNDSRRYMLDWDEIYYSGEPINWKDTSKK